MSTKSETKHTPGPWTIDESANYASVYADQSDVLICDFNTSCGVSPQERANLDLIAAAPELLKALEYAQECIEKKINVSDDFLWELDALISKAKGG